MAEFIFSVAFLALLIASVNIYRLVMAIYYFWRDNNDQFHI